METFRRLSDRISLVLIDATMPLMSGHEVLREIRQIRRDVPVILSSHYNEVDVMNRWDEGRGGAGENTGFIQKPYTARQLMQKIRAALGISRGGGPREPGL